MNCWFFREILFVYLLVLCSSCELRQNGSSNVGNTRRSKRIMNGDKFFNRKEVPYKVIEYYVWIGNVHDCTEEPSWWERGLFGSARNFIAETISLFAKCHVKKETLVCGGALIAPKIVQTACHCLSYYVDPTQKNSWGTAKLLNHYENKMQIFMGAIDVAQFQYPVFSDKFFIHEKCGVFNVAPKPLRYDIGWLVLELEVPWQEGVLFGTWGKLDYAGPYPKQDIIDTYNTVVGQRHVCLVVGFGLNEKGVVSQHMRQAWIQFLDYENCYDVTYLSRGHKQYYEYNDSVSWICAYQLPEVSSSKFRGRHNCGDSGGPITCSNNYVGLVSSYTKYSQLRVGFIEMLAETALFYFLDANSVESRVQWETQLLARAPPDELRALRRPSEPSLDHPKLKKKESRKKG